MQLHVFRPVAEGGELKRSPQQPLAPRRRLAGFLETLPKVERKRACWAENNARFDRLDPLDLICRRKRASAAARHILRLYRLIEDGVTELDDLLRDRIATLKLERERAQAALVRIRTQIVPAAAIPPEVIEQFGRAMRENITTGEVPFRKAYLRSVIDRIEVDDHAIRIVGDRGTLEQVVAGKSVPATGVRSLVRKWRARHDSNV
ncbi:hypothetical protein [Bosea sp. Root381]|uniref:hypothetical protein n=1 Tax=Bosea sp. Root381 TaxID=1736524 RepID=UPI0012E38ACB|nr:hypothetical protein [Bosea sp. Root381]